MELKEVAVSGAVGKYVIATGKKVYLRGITLTPSGANATVKVRDALSSTVFFARAPSAQGSKQFIFERPKYFTNGLHVAVIGTNAVAYVEID